MQAEADLVFSMYHPVIIGKPAKLHLPLFYPLRELILRWFEAVPDGPGKARGRARRPRGPVIAMGDAPLPVYARQGLLGHSLAFILDPLEAPQTGPPWTFGIQVQRSMLDQIHTYYKASFSNARGPILGAVPSSQ